MCLVAAVIGTAVREGRVCGLLPSAHTLAALYRFFTNATGSVVVASRGIPWNVDGRTSRRRSWGRSR